MKTVWRSLAVVTAASFLLSGCVMAARQAGKRLVAEVSTPEVKTQGDVPAAVRAEMMKVVQSGVPGITAIVMKDGKQVFRLDTGDITPETRYPVASASKWMTAALVMRVVDEGKLSLDAPVCNVLAEFCGDSSAITLRMLLAQTSGEGSLKSFADIRQDPRMTLAQSAAEIAKRKLEDVPGTTFKYGGPGFQVAGAMVEKVTGKRWADLFAERIAEPLGMTHTTWERLPSRGATAAETLNPLLQGGVVTTADDYMRFLAMLAAHGRFEGKQILSERAVAEMETAQTLGKPMAYVPRGVKSKMQYGLGNWCERWQSDGRCTLVSSPGAFGTYPWIDRDSGLYGIFFVKDRLPRIGEHLVAARKAVLGAPPP